MLYFSDVSDVLLQSIFKLNDDEKVFTGIERKPVNIER